MNLQAAEGLLEALPEQGPEVAKAIECVKRASALTREGMAEARRAILALREDERRHGPRLSGARVSGPGVSGRVRPRRGRGAGRPGGR